MSNKRKKTLFTSDLIKFQPEKFTKEELDSYKKLDIMLKQYPVIPLKNEITIGVVIFKDNSSVWLDIGNKAPAIIGKKEFIGSFVDFETIKEGDTIEVFVLSSDCDVNLSRSAKKLGNQTIAKVSLTKGLEERKWEALEKSMLNNKVYDATILRNEKANGFIVELKGFNVKAFVPISQIYSLNANTFGMKDNEIIDVLSSHIGKNLKVEIIDVDASKEKIIVREFRGISENVYNKSIYNEGDIVDVEIVRIVPFGLLVNLGNLNGLIHKSNISWGRVDIKYIENNFNIGDKIKAKIITPPSHKNPGSFSIKHLTKDPWLDRIKKYKVGQIVKVKITKVDTWGGVAQLDYDKKMPVLNGIVHTSYCSQKLVEKLKEGDEIMLKIFEIDLGDGTENATKKIMLGDVDM